MEEVSQEQKQEQQVSREADVSNGARRFLGRGEAKGRCRDQELVEVVLVTLVVTSLVARMMIGGEEAREGLDPDNSLLEAIAL